MKLFKKLRFDTDLQNEGQSSSFRRAGFQSAPSIVRSLKVVDDNSERGVSLLQPYNRLSTKNE